MAARLEVEIDGINTGLKAALNDSLSELARFNGALGNIKPTSVNTLNSSLNTTKNLLKDIGNIAASLRLSIGNRGLFESPSSELNAARTASENYRTESARLTAELQALRLQQAQNRQQTIANAGSYTEAQRRLTALGVAIRSAEGGFRSNSPVIQAQIREYRTLNDELRRFDAQLGNHQRSVGNYRSALQGLSGLATTYFGFTALLAAGRTVIRNNAEISDSLADVRRTAGVSAKQAEELAKSLKSIDTRTNLKDLLGISVIGGQLGIANDQLAGFTKAIDELAVTLSGELKGGAEGIAKSLGVLDNVFKVTQSNAGNVEKSYNQIGSAILGLGQSGLATGDFLADFAERVGGVAKQAGISLPVILSYGAVLQENGVSAEVAGSSFKRLISAISSNSGKFFQVAKFADANLTLKEFNTIVNTDTKKALDLFFNGINKGGASTIAFGSILKSLKIAGAGASQSVSALANNLPALNQHIKESTKDFNNGTISADQFAIKNNTLASSIDKLNNAFTNMTSNPDSNIGKFFKSLVDFTTDGINGIDSLIGKIKELNKELIISKTLRGDKAIFSSKETINKTFEERRKASTEAFKDEIKGRGAATADMISAGKTEAEIRKLLTGEIYKQSEAQKRLNNNLAFITNPNNVGAALDAQISKTNKLRVVYAQQIAVVDRLREKLKKAEKTPARSNISAPILGSTKGNRAPINRANEIVKRSARSEDLFGLTGVDKEVESVRQKYVKFYADLVDNAKKSTEGRKTLEADLATVQKNEAAEISTIIISEQERVANEIQRILNDSGVAANENRTKELAAVQKWYDAEIIKARDSSEIIVAINAGRAARIEAIDSKYEAKRIEAQNKLVDKITSLSEKQFTLNENFSNKTTQRNKEALKERLKDINDHFNNLKKLYANNPLALNVLGISQTGIQNQTTTNFKAAENAGSDKVLSDLVTGFGTKFYQTLTTINEQADQSFTSIIGSLGESLSGMLQDTFSMQLSQILKDLVSGVKVSATQAVTALAGIAGGLVSGASKKTDSAGQALGGALTGGAAGFAVGGPIGAVAGGILGALGGLLGASKARKQEQELQKQQLDEARKQTELMRQNATAYTSSIIGRMTDQGVLTNVEVGAFGQLKAVVNGKQIDFILDRTNNSR